MALQQIDRVAVAEAGRSRAARRVSALLATSSPPLKIRTAAKDAI
jgi:hypothetical protein